MAVHAPERLVIVSSDGHVGPPAERYREYMAPAYREAFDEWFAEYIPYWLTKGTKARGSVKDAVDANMWGADYADAFAQRASAIPCTAQWNPSIAYQEGDTVSFKSTNFKASYWSQGKHPITFSGFHGSGQPWIIAGSCVVTAG